MSRSVPQIAARLIGLSESELALIDRIIERVQRGRATYGAWDAAAERRDLPSERLEELLDALVYAAMADLLGVGDVK